MKNFFKLLSIISLLSVFCIFPVASFAEEIKSFESQITAHKNGELDVMETIVYDFGALNRHGIYRDIPKITKVGDLYRVTQIKVNRVDFDGKDASFQDQSDPNRIYLKIGDPDKTISGVHTFAIFYTVQNGIGSNFETHDEIYWSVTGNGWDVPILNASATVSTDFGVSLNKAACYTGIKNSRQSDCVFSSGIFKTARVLNPSEGLSIVAGFPKETFPKSVLQKVVASSNSFPIGVKIDPFFAKILVYLIIAIPVFLNLILAPFLLIWYFKKRFKKRFRKAIVNFDFPEDEKGVRITPAEAGTIDNATLDQNDVIATIFDFAIRKLIKIEQVKSKKVLGLFGDNDDFNLIKLKELTDGNSFEVTLWSKLFAPVESIKISSLKKDFYQTFLSLGNKIFEILMARGFYTKNPKTQKGLLLTGAVVSFLTLNLILGGVLLFLSQKLIGRTDKGDEMDWKIDGLKIFLKNMSREHTWQAENLITVEKYIPFAIALGYIKEFMGELKVIYPDYKPDWYSGNLAFYAISSNMISSMSFNFTTSAPSSSSGFSGGGFSGGGGGGGGGGSW